MITTDLEFLRRSCQDTSIFDSEPIIQKLEHELEYSLVKGVGLSANQIEIPKKVCIIRTDKISLNLVNPIIIEKYDLCSFNGDGCLSIPGIFLTTKRFNEIYVKDSLHFAGIILTGIEAVIVQHEIDHLNGLLMFDREIKLPQRNQLCWCNSGKKFKYCHYGKVIR